MVNLLQILFVIFVICIVISVLYEIFRRFTAPRLSSHNRSLNPGEISDHRADIFSAGQNLYRRMGHINRSPLPNHNSALPRDDNSSSIISDQDAEYEESLAIDQAKEISERERVEENQRAICRKQEELENKLMRRTRKVDEIPPEPTGKDVANIKIFFPNGTKVLRKFSADDTIKALYDFVDSRMLHGDLLEIDRFQLSANYPRRIFETDEKTWWNVPEGSDENGDDAKGLQTLREAGLVPQDMVYIEAL
eukprot:TRINITY_DN11240_c0_g1_i1.p1 TRINITY_DN11240_c0_g1~~TRINITY_DN11240_c0_g1_i1.p1  ORF type:complete len:250 (+),score=56.95 TRINITY_DN11240_c0_g1_i1:3-752(+)